MRRGSDERRLLPLGRGAGVRRHGQSRVYGVPLTFHGVSSPVHETSRNLLRPSMRVVLQRVSRASVTIEGRVAGAIERGFCLLVGFTHGDTGSDGRLDGREGRRPPAFLRRRGQDEPRPRRGRRRGAGGLPVHALRRRGQGPPALVHRRGAARERRSRCTSGSSPRCATAASRSRPASSAPTCRWRSTTTARSP